MARKKPAHNAKKKAAAKKPARKPVRKTAKKKAVRAAKRATPKKKTGKAKKGAAARKGAVKQAAPAKTRVAARKPNIDRLRKTVADIHGIPSSLGASGGASAAKSGRAEFKGKLSKVTSASPALTAGDVDADWEAAEAVGDKAPGGDNPTPDQDVVDDIGRALGVEYEDDEKLQGGAEISERDRHRWELDPSSKDDFDDE
jgi:hypothetical protein